MNWKAIGAIGETIGAVDNQIALMTATVILRRIDH